MSTRMAPASVVKPQYGGICCFLNKHFSMVSRHSGDSMQYPTASVKVVLVLPLLGVGTHPTHSNLPKYRRLEEDNLSDL